MDYRPRQGVKSFVYIHPYYDRVLPFLDRPIDHVQDEPQRVINGPPPIEPKMTIRENGG